MIRFLIPTMLLLAAIFGVGCTGSTPTDTPVATPTFSPTPTDTPTPTPKPTSTSTRTPSPTATPTPIPTSTPIPTPTPTPSLDESGVRYLALGDSLAAGVGASDPTTTAYVPLFHQFLLAEQGEDTVLINLGHSGDTSSSLIAHGHLAAALTQIGLGDVTVVSLDIGGNDFSALVPICSGGLTPLCLTAVNDTFTTFSNNFDFILDELRMAMDSDAPIIVMTYYNSLVHPDCPFNPLAPLGDILLEGDEPLPEGLNDIIRSIAAIYDAGVAETFGLIGPSDLQPDCLHTNDAGYKIIADAFIDSF